MPTEGPKYGPGLAVAWGSVSEFEISHFQESLQLMGSREFFASPLHMAFFIVVCPLAGPSYTPKALASSRLSL